MQRLKENLGKEITLDYSQFLNQIIQAKIEGDQYFFAKLSCFRQTFSQMYSTKRYEQSTAGAFKEEMRATVEPLGFKFNIKFEVKNPQNTLPNILIATKYAKSNRFKDNSLVENYIMPNEEIVCTDSKRHDLATILSKKENGELKCTYCNRSLKRNNQIVIFDDDKNNVRVYGKGCFERYNCIKNLYNVIVYFENDFDYLMNEIIDKKDNTKTSSNMFGNYVLKVVQENEKFNDNELKKAKEIITQKITPQAFKGLFCNFSRTPENSFDNLTDFFSTYNVSGEVDHDYRRLSSSVKSLSDSMIFEIKSK